MSTDTIDYRSLTERLYQLLLDGEIDDFIHHLSKDVTFTVFGPQGAPICGVYNSHAGVRHWLVRRGETFQVDQLMPPPGDKLLVDGSRVAAFGQERGTMAAAPTVGYSAEWSHLWVYEGRHVKAWFAYITIEQKGKTWVRWSSAGPS